METAASRRLGEVRRRPEGLAAAQEAVTVYRELVGGNRDAYMPALAMSVTSSMHFSGTTRPASCRPVILTSRLEPRAAALFAGLLTVYR
jgi:hypothetical protein